MATAGWREGFGTLAEEEADELKEIGENSRKQAGSGLLERQQDAFEAMADMESENETP